MGLLQPEAGVLFWMTLAFAVVFIVLARYGFPVIVRAIEERKAYIDRSLEEARAAERKLRELDAEGQAVRAAAERERGRILREAAETRDALLAEAPQPGRRPRANGRRSCRMPVIRWRCSRSPLRRRCCASGWTTRRRRRGSRRRCSTRWRAGANERRHRICIPD